MKPNPDSSTWYIYGDKKAEKYQFDFVEDDVDGDAFLKYCWDVLEDIVGEEDFNKQKPPNPGWTRGKDTALNLLKPTDQEKGKKLCVWLTNDWSIAPHVAKIRDVLATYKLFLWPSSCGEVEGSDGQSGFNNDGTISWQMQPTFFAKSSQSKMATVFFGFGGEAGRPSPKKIYSSQMTLLSSLTTLVY